MSDEHLIDEALMKERLERAYENGHEAGYNEGYESGFEDGKASEDGRTFITIDPAQPNATASVTFTTSTAGT